MVTEQEVRDKLRELIQQAAPQAAVWSDWPLEMDEQFNANCLKSRADNNEIHAWIMQRRGRTEAPAGTSKEIVTWTFEIWLFYGARSKAQEPSTMTIFQREIDEVAAWLAARRTLELDNAGMAVKGHRGLTMYESDKFPLSGRIVHIAKCQLDLELYQNIC
jgi:hypothetical protein